MTTQNEELDLGDHPRVHWVGVDPERPEDLDVALRDGIWGVPEDERDTIDEVEEGDCLLFYHRDHGLVLCEVVSEPYSEYIPVWPDRDYPHRVRISDPLESDRYSHLGELHDCFRAAGENLTSPARAESELVGATGKFRRLSEAEVCCVVWRLGWSYPGWVPPREPAEVEEVEAEPVLEEEVAAEAEPTEAAEPEEVVEPAEAAEPAAEEEEEAAAEVADPAEEAPAAEEAVSGIEAEGEPEPEEATEPAAEEEEPLPDEEVAAEAPAAEEAVSGIEAEGEPEPKEATEPAEVEEAEEEPIPDEEVVAEAEPTEAAEPEEVVEPEEAEEPAEAAEPAEVPDAAEEAPAEGPRIVLAPATGNWESRDRFRETMTAGVPWEEIADHLDGGVVDALRETSDEEAHVWGVGPSQDGANRIQWEAVRPGDRILFTGRGRVFASARVLHTHQDPDLALELWGEREDGETWEYLFVLTSPEAQDIPYPALNRVAGYEENYRVPRLNLLDGDQSRRVLDAFSGLLEEGGEAAVLPASSEEEMAAPEEPEPSEEEGRDAPGTRREVDIEDLERLLFAHREFGRCALCGNLLPVRLLALVFVKPLEACDPQELEDVENDVMPACRLGCQGLFEEGFLIVDGEGVVARGRSEPLTDPVEEYLDRVEGNRCEYWHPGSEPFYRWHAAEAADVPRGEEGEDGSGTA